MDVNIIVERPPCQSEEKRFNGIVYLFQLRTTPISMQ